MHFASVDLKETIEFILFFQIDWGSPVLHLSCPASVLSCILPVLHSSCPEFFLSCIWPVLHPSCPGAIMSCLRPPNILSCCQPFLLPSYPASIQSCIWTVLHLSCPAEVLSCCHPVLQPSWSAPSCLVSILSCLCPVLSLSCHPSIKRWARIQIRFCNPDMNLNPNLWWGGPQYGCCLECFFGIVYLVANLANLVYVRDLTVLLWAKNDACKGLEVWLTVLCSKHWLPSSYNKCWQHTRLQP